MKRGIEWLKEVIAASMGAIMLLVGGILMEIEVVSSALGGKGQLLGLLIGSILVFGGTFLWNWSRRKKILGIMFILLSFPPLIVNFGSKRYLQFSLYAVLFVAGIILVFLQERADKLLKNTQTQK